MEPHNAVLAENRAQSTALMETKVRTLCVRMKLSVGMDERRGDGHQLRRHHHKAHESASALIGASLRADSEGSIGRTLDGRGSDQNRCQPLVKCDGNCSEMPVNTW